MTRCRQSAFGIVFLMLLVPVSSSAQIGATTGAIVGTVRDDQKLALPGVTITATGPALMGTRDAVSEGNGTFRIPALPPGVYAVVFELAGFAPVRREGISISVGFTATIDVALTVGGLEETITVSGASPVVDKTSTAIVTNLSAASLEGLQGSRDYASVTSFLPGVIMSRPSVGGRGSVTYQRSTRYGLVGNDRGELEGINSTEAAAGGQEVAYSDSDSFEDMSVSVVGNGAEMPNPGTYTKVVSKSGSNQFKGRLYADYQDDAFESYNISDEQVARIGSAPGSVPILEGNRLIGFRDFGADLGGYALKDRLWWYSAYRNQRTEQFELNLLDDTHVLSLEVFTHKVDFKVRGNDKLTWYWFSGTKRQNKSILANFGDTSITTADALQSQKWENGVWKVEYNTTLGSNVFVEARGGNFFERGTYDGEGTNPRYRDTGTNRVYGNAGFSYSNSQRPQGSGALNYFKDGWAGSHNFKIGGEVMRSLTWGTSGVFNNLETILNNGTPTQVRIYEAPLDETERRGNTGWGVYVQDTWRLNSRLTLNLGIRGDRQQSYVPEQTGPTGQQFARIESPNWTNWASRLGVVYDLRGDGRTVIKANYGQYFTYAYTTLANVMNPLPAQSSRLYTWTPTNPPIQDGFPVYVPGTEGALLSVSGARADGTPATTVDPDIRNAYSRQALVFVEREIASGWAARTGFVWNGLRSGYGQINANQPYEAFDVPITVQDPGPDGRAGTSDDGGEVQAFNLNPAYLTLRPNQVYANIPYSDSDHYTWEIQTTRRHRNRWSLQTSFTYTWQRLGVLQSAPYLEAPALSPNTAINSIDGQHRFGIWGAKVQANLDVWKGLQITPSVRHQSGPPFSRTFSARLNYNSAVLIRSEPVGAERMPHSNLVDVRALKNVKVGKAAVELFFDVYNVFNTNAVQELVRSSGPTFLRPSVITPPRVARIGVKLTF